ncbi:Protein CutA -like protein [Sarcoptes scabiei]|uniref:Protein CutA -like protein n=1 Tax=Sarcoptes scabiei TaxID=52283 RepID=A0A834VHD3_SARSC|nr:Protein CutA -like protein [Sarcoptes scabiei]UXI21227.1 palmitoyltransferase ZDHHC24 [Sarcoptes scabiei]
MSNRCLNRFVISNLFLMLYRSGGICQLKSSKMSMDSLSLDYRIGYVTVSDTNAAKDLARKIVKTKLAACVNIVPTVTSIYVWQNELEESDEALMIIKTHRDRIDQLIEFIKANHSYTVPEIIFTTIQNGNPDYLKWISDSVKTISNDDNDDQNKN